MNRAKPALPKITVEDDVFNRNNRVIDDQAHCCGQTAERHQVECLPHDLQGDKHRQHRDRNERAATREVPHPEEDDKMIDARTSPSRCVAHALMDSLTIIDWS